MLGGVAQVSPHQHHTLGRHPARVQRPLLGEGVGGEPGPRGEAEAAPGEGPPAPAHLEAGLRVLRHLVDHVWQRAPGAAVTAQNLRGPELVVPGEVPRPARHQDSCSSMEAGELVLGFPTYILWVRGRDTGSTEDNTQETW